MIHPLRYSLLLVLLSRAAPGAAPPPSQTDFPAQEFQERRQKLLEKIGEQALAVIPGSTGPGGFILPRQTNEFYYLTIINFSIDPQLRVPEEGLYIRLEDVVVVTADGVENFTEFLPSELDDIEKIVGQGGIVEPFPPEPAGRD